MCRSILITAYLTYLTKFKKLGSILGVDIKNELFNVFCGLVSAKAVDPQIFDM